nr:MAG TPA: hypothetical protein [Caudoviricetes sp.]
MQIIIRGRPYGLKYFAVQGRAVGCLSLLICTQSVHPRAKRCPI